MKTNSSLGVIRFPRSILVGFLSLLAVVTMSACGGSDRVPVNTVAGNVSLRGKPAAGATIMFVAIDPAEEARKLTPMTVVREDGTFKLATYGRGDGAPTGEYHVVITWPEPDGSTESDLTQKDYKRLVKNYGDPDNPKLKATVKSGHNQLPPFELE